MADRVHDGLAHAIGGGAQGVGVVLLDERDAARLGHLDHGDVAVEHAVVGVDLLADGTGDLDLENLAATGRDNRVERALAAVGDGEPLHPRVGKHPADALLEVLAHLAARCRALERVWGDEH